MYDDSGNIDYLFEDEGIRDIFRAELYDEIVADFTDSRMRSFYEEDPQVAAPALRALVDARSLLSQHHTGAFLFAAIAAEVGVRSVLYGPIVYGLVHSSTAAAVITKLAHKDKGFVNVLRDLLAAHGGIDLRKDHRPGVSKTLWQELHDVREKRNQLAHRAEVASMEEAEAAIGVAGYVLEDLFKKLAERLGFHLHGSTLCNSFHNAVPEASSSLTW